MSYNRDYSKVLRYAATEDTKNLLASAAQNRELRDDATTHGAIADSLEESGESPQLAHLIKRQYGLGEFAGNAAPGWFGLHQLRYPDNTPDQSEPIHEDNNFSYHLSHTSPMFGEKYGHHWNVEAVSKLPGSEGVGYNFKIPHKDASLIPSLFPDSSKFIRSEKETSPDLREQEGNLFSDAQIYKGIDRG